MMQSVTEFLYRIIKTYLMIYLTILYSAKRWREKTLANLANPEPFASFTHPNLYHKTAGINSATNEY